MFWSWFWAFDPLHLGQYLVLACEVAGKPNQTKAEYSDTTLLQCNISKIMSPVHAVLNNITQTFFIKLETFQQASADKLS